MSTTKLATLQIDLFEDYDDVTTGDPRVQYYARIHWSGTNASMTSPNFSRPFDAFHWAGDVIS